MANITKAMKADMAEFNKAQQQQPSDSWISVEDRLPEKMDNYRVYIKSDTEAYQRDAIYSESHGGWIRPNWPEPLNNVTHWMPLPEPPNSNGAE